MSFSAEKCFPQTESHPILGALCIIGASLLFASSSAFIKVISNDLNGPSIVFFRNLFGLLFVLPWTITQHKRLTLKTAYFHLHLIRSVAGLGAMNCFYTALAHMNIAEAVLLSFTSPLFIPIVAAVWIGEKGGLKVWGAVVIGFIGVILVLRPGFVVIEPVAFIGLTAGFLDGASMVSIRRMSRSEPAGRIVFYFTVLGTILSAIPLYWFWATPNMTSWTFLLIIGLMASSGQLLLSKGYSLAPAAKIGPFYYSVVIFATIIGWVIWDDILSLATLFGAALICGAGIMSIHTRRRDMLTQPQ
jgi:drug/metabolite transporter (DMT)-like permease